MVAFIGVMIIQQPGTGLGEGHLGALVFAGGIFPGNHDFHRAEKIRACHGVQGGRVKGKGGKMQELYLILFRNGKNQIKAIFVKGDRLRHNRLPFIR